MEDIVSDCTSLPAHVSHQESQKYGKQLWNAFQLHHRVFELARDIKASGNKKGQSGQVGVSCKV